MKVTISKIEFCSAYTGSSDYFDRLFNISVAGGVPFSATVEWIAACFGEDTTMFSELWDIMNDNDYEALTMWKLTYGT